MCLVMPGNTGLVDSGAVVLLPRLQGILDSMALLPKDRILPRKVLPMVLPSPVELIILSFIKPHYIFGFNNEPLYGMFIYAWGKPTRLAPIPKPAPVRAEAPTLGA